MLCVGLMSGTSMDGIDAALVNVQDNRLLAGITRPYSESLRLSLQAISSGEWLEASRFSQLNTLVGREFALAVLQLLQVAAVDASTICAIGSHGQTICHDATAEIPYTLQLGCAHTISVLTGITVVADFRTRDVALGGQGAPFAPIYHQAVFGRMDLPLAVVNIGGIANVTFLDPAGAVSGYDVGPGNCLMDAWASLNLGCAYDAGGAWAASGRVNTTLLSALLADPYFKQTWPKSIGKEYFSMAWLSPYLQPDLPPEDVQATLLALTVTAICRAIDDGVRRISRVLICGGGVHNATLLSQLMFQLPHSTIESTECMGVDPDFVEAMMMAWLAEQALSGRSLDLSAITGARQSAVLGAIYLK